MSYNNPRNYNTRHSGRFNRPGSFVPATSTNHQTYEVKAPAAPAAPASPAAPAPAAPAPAVPAPLPPQPVPPTPVAGSGVTIKEDEDQEMSVAGSENQTFTSGPSHRMPFFKTKLGGVKKITNKERRRRQNALLRRLTTPKNALMCINEMLPNEQIANQFKVEMAPVDSSYYSSGTHSFCAELALDGQTYKGYGESKLTARNAAAEQAIRDIVLKKMERYSETLAANAAAAAAAGADADADADKGEGAEETETEALPMIQLLSFALHKLFAEWEGAGHHVPQLRPTKGDRSQNAMEEDLVRPVPPPAPPSVPRVPKDRKMPPDNASSMHPAMLLTMVRPMATYRELGTEGDKPQNTLFTVGVDVDGQSFFGKAPSKKEARKNAARVACKALFGMTFDDEL